MAEIRLNPDSVSGTWGIIGAVSYVAALAGDPDNPDESSYVSEEEGSVATLTLTFPDLPIAAGIVTEIEMEVAGRIEIAIPSDGGSCDFQMDIDSVDKGTTNIEPIFGEDFVKSTVVNGGWCQVWTRAQANTIQVVMTPQVNGKDNREEVQFAALALRCLYGEDDFLSYLISVWEFEVEEDAEPRADSWGHHDMPSAGTTTHRSPGFFGTGNAVEFSNANSDRLTAIVSAHNLHSGLGFDDLSITAWIYIDAWDGGICGNWQTGQRNYRFRINSAGKLQFWTNNTAQTNQNNLQTAGIMPVGEWIFVYCTFDEDGGVDNKKVGFKTANGGSSSEITNTWAESIADSLGHLQIGNSNGVSAFDGAINQLAIWGRPLSDEDIDWLFNDGAGRPFDEWAANPQLLNNGRNRII